MYELTSYVRNYLSTMDDDGVCTTVLDPSLSLSKLSWKMSETHLQSCHQAVVGHITIGEKSTEVEANNHKQPPFEHSPFLKAKHVAWFSFFEVLAHLSGCLCPQESFLLSTLFSSRSSTFRSPVYAISLSFALDFPLAAGSVRSGLSSFVSREEKCF